MDDFSWSDGFRAALRPCLSCFATREEEGASDANTKTHSRRNDLEGLLRDPEGSDVDAETWSLHSNIGRDRRKRKGKGRKGSKKGGSSFFSFFGRSNSQAIRLPESDSEEEETEGRGSSRRNGPRGGSLARSNSSSSSANFDSDAASLDATAIAKLTAQEALERAEAAAREAEIRAEVERRMEEERREKAERKRNRAERRELRRASQLISMGVEDIAQDAFDIQNPDFTPSQLSSSGYLTSPQFVVPGYSAPPIPADFTQPRVRIANDNLNPHGSILNIPSPLSGVVEEEHDDGGDAHTDFGGEVYTIKTRKSKSNLRSIHGGNSDTGSSRSSRSQTTSLSSSSTVADPSSVAFQRFLAMAALNGGPAALAALPSPSTPALSLSPSSVSGLGSGYTSGLDPSAYVNEDIVPSLADAPKKRKKRRPETWIAPSTASPNTPIFDSQPMTVPPTPQPQLSLRGQQHIPQTTIMNNNISSALDLNVTPRRPDQPSATRRTE